MNLSQDQSNKLILKVKQLLEILSQQNLYNIQDQLQLLMGFMKQDDQQLLLNQ